MAVKGIMDYINEDRNLQEKVTYEEFEGGGTSPKNNDYTVEEAYDAYCAAMDEYNTEKAGVS